MILHSIPKWKNFAFLEFREMRNFDSKILREICEIAKSKYPLKHHRYFSSPKNAKLLSSIAFNFLYICMLNFILKKVHSNMYVYVNFWKFPKIEKRGEKHTKMSFFFCFAKFVLNISHYIVQNSHYFCPLQSNLMQCSYKKYK